MSGIIFAFFATAFLLSYGAFYTWLTPVRLVSDGFEKRKLTLYGFKLAGFSILSLLLALLLLLMNY